MPRQNRKVRITNTVIEAMEIGQRAWDSELKGFGVWKQATCATYFVKKRIHGKQIWKTIGQHGSPWVPSTARKRAIEIMQAAGVGVDIVEKEKQKSAQTYITLKELAEEFKKDHVVKTKPQTQRDYKWIIDKRIVPVLGKMRVETITKGDVAKLHRKYADKPRMANLMVSIFSKMMSWAEEFDYRPKNTNPCQGIKRYRETRRQRYLTMEEVSKLGSAIREAEEEGSITVFAAAAFRLLIFTGARQGEILSLEWSYVDWERKRLWLPDSKTGHKAISLNDQAIEVLTALPRLQSNPYVIVGKLKGKHLVNIRKPWLVVRDKASLKDVRIHDLRHSFASVAVAVSGSLPMIGKLLGHKNTKTTAQYAHLADEPVDRLNQEVGNLMGKAMDGKGKSGS